MLYLYKYQLAAPREQHYFLRHPLPMCSLLCHCRLVFIPLCKRASRTSSEDYQRHTRNNLAIIIVACNTPMDILFHQ